MLRLETAAMTPASKVVAAARAWTFWNTHSAHTNCRSSSAPKVGKARPDGYKCV